MEGDPLIISPPQLYQVNRQVTPIQSVSFTGTVGSNRSVVAAVSAQRIRFMGAIMQASGGVGSVQFKDGSGGTAFGAAQKYPAAADGSPFLIPIIDGGYFSTSVGIGLFADVADFDALCTIFYISYVP